MKQVFMPLQLVVTPRLILFKKDETPNKCLNISSLLTTLILWQCCVFDKWIITVISILTEDD